MTQNEQQEKTKNTRNIFQLYFDNWKNMFTFKGRSNRSEFVVFWSIGSFLLYFCNPYFYNNFFSYICLIGSAFIITALFTLTIRRGHDMNLPSVVSCLLFLTPFFILKILSNTYPFFIILYLLSILLYFIILLYPATNKKNKYGKEAKPASKIALTITWIFAFILINASINLITMIYMFVIEQIK